MITDPRCGSGSGTVDDPEAGRSCTGDRGEGRATPTVSSRDTRSMERNQGTVNG